MKTELVLVTFDLDSKRSTPNAYATTYKLLESIGLKGQRHNIELPTTTLVGTVQMRESADPSTLCDQLKSALAAEGVPITHLVVAFLDNAAYFVAA